MLYIVYNMHYLQTNSSVHEINTGYKNKLHVPSVRLSTKQKGTTYSAFKILNMLPTRISVLKNGKIVFKPALRKYLFTPVFYSVEEFLSNDKLLFMFRSFFNLLISSCSSFILTIFQTPIFISSVCNVRSSIHFIVSPTYCIYALI